VGRVPSTRFPLGHSAPGSWKQNRGPGFKFVAEVWVQSIVRAQPAFVHVHAIDEVEKKKEKEALLELASEKKNL